MANEHDELQEHIDHLSTVIAKLAPDGAVLMVNAAAVDLAGLPKDELVGRKIWETAMWLGSQRDPSELQQKLEEAISTGSAHIEFSYKTPEQCYAILDLYLQPVFDEDHRPRYIMAEGHDITERRRAEAALHESEERFRSIFENAPLGIFQATAEGRLVLINNTFAKAFGYDSPEELMAEIPGHFAKALLVHVERWPDVLRAVIGTQGFCRFENEHRRRDGSTFMANVYIRAVREGERVALLEGFEEDIEERVRAQKRLAEEKQLSETIINSFPGLFYMINEQGKMIWWNDYRDQHFEYTVDERGYSDVLAYVYEPDRPLAAEAIAKALSGEQASVEVRLPHRDGEVRDYYATGARVDMGGEPRIVGVAVDITERKQAEAHKRAFYREAIRSVTQGKLDLASREEIGQYLDKSGFSTVIDQPGDLTEARHELQQFYESAGFSEETLLPLITGVGEAMANAIKHAGAGKVYAGIGPECIWAAVADAGPGIAALTLPGATLRKGFSTKKSLGMGYSIIMDCSSKILLATDERGTTVVLIKRVVESEDLLESWDELQDDWSSPAAEPGRPAIG